MREKLGIFLALFVLIIVLIGLNAASFVQKEKVPDTEYAPNRSTFNTGATGTRAFYDLLAETGRRVTRWQEPPSALLSAGKNKPDTLVLIGTLRRKFEGDEIKQLLEWVAAGGKLVIIDRQPPDDLISTTANWDIVTDEDKALTLFNADPADQTQMTDQTVAAKPVQPTIYTIGINSVQPSRFASSVRFERFSENISSQDKISRGTPTPAPIYKNTPAANGDEEDFESDEPVIATPTPSKQANNKVSNQTYQTQKKVETVKSAPQITVKASPQDGKTSPQAAPFVHLANDRKNLLVDFPFGSGKIVYLADPYIVTNGGISLVDNAQIAINIVASGDGLIAFDEYHQGYGSNRNQLLEYFAGTPVVAIVLQLAVLVGLIFYSQSRRFARPLPENEPNRLSKLEYVAAMAELQQRTKAFDLAIENIYSDFRRRVARSFGVDNFTTKSPALAQMIAERLPTEDVREIDELMQKCEDISHGEATNKKEVLELAGRLRALEEKLGLQRRKKRRQK